LFAGLRVHPATATTESNPNPVIIRACFILSVICILAHLTTRYDALFSGQVPLAFFMLLALFLQEQQLAHCGPESM
jgi:hypothetical protein